MSPQLEAWVQAIAISPAAQAEPRLVPRATALPGRGLEGDRYASGQGTFSDGTSDGRALTLIEAEVLDELSRSGSANLTAAQARRNVITRGIALNELVGQRFFVGGVECEGRRLCEPCAHLERLTRAGVLTSLVNRGGLRADILSAGEIQVGDPVRPSAPA
ncbi:MAG: MOSC domain-containing protein [Thermoleophilaceae bacterium]|nr:MOSC domain-containing protein [Thermoleophilaceae bacterium]